MSASTVGSTSDFGAAGPAHAHGGGGESHVVQFYESEAFLADAVSDFLSGGLRAGEPVVVIATAAHRAAFAQRLADRGFDVSALAGSGAVTMLDASETLAKFMVGDRPDRARFQQAVGGVLGKLSRQSPTGHFLAYGEMVDLLWRAGKPEAAIQLEELWNEIGAVHAFSLLCAYAIQNFGQAGDRQGFEEVCRTHSCVVPTETYVALRDSDSRSREVCVLQQRARALETEVEHRKHVEAALREALAVRDDFLCVAGHELRTPLTVLRLQLASLLSSEAGAMRPRSERRLAALAGQTERLARLAERMLDVSQMGGRLTLRPERLDLSAVARDMVDSLADVAASAGCNVTVLGDVGVTGCWDRDRLEQVMQDLLSNAYKFGRGAPVQVLVKGGHDGAQLVVRDGGPGIAPADHARIFERFERPASTDSYGGLGLGLWIARRIVEEHGGDIQVESAPGKGSTFTVTLPYSPPA
jgi:signal transduction histidine kinase